MHVYIKNINLSAHFMIIPPPPPPPQPTIGDCVFYIENGRPAAELAAAIWLTYHRKYKKSFPVKVMDQITYYRPGIKEGTLYIFCGQN